MSKRLLNPQGETLKESDYTLTNISAISIVGVLCFPLYYFIWHDLFPQPYENLTLRLIGSLLCLALFFYPHWPIKLKRFFFAYWHITILYSLPFFFTFMMLENELNQAWSMSAFVAIFVMMMLVTSWKNLIALFSVGSLLGWLAFVVDKEEFIIPDGFIQYLLIAFFAVCVGSVFNYRSSMARVRFEKLEILVAASGNIAHELRTPLLSIKSNSSGLDAYMSALLETYQIAKDHGLNIPFIRKEHKKKLIDLPKRIGKEVDYANTVIDMLLVSSDKGIIQTADFRKQSIRHCIEGTLERYPFNSEEDRQRIICTARDDFTFIGSDVLTVHILFNLLKNALYAIAKAGKGDITISISSSEHYHQLHFRDTGSGIKKDDLSRIFDRFYSTSKYGHGVGLSYCSMVMQSFHGSIECFSVEHEYTEFKLNFPKEFI